MNDEELEKRIYQMSNNISELLTMNSSFYDRIIETQKQVKSEQKSSRHNEQKMYKLETDMQVMESEINTLIREKNQLQSDFDKREEKSQNDRRALWTTIAGVAGLILTGVGLLFKWFGIG